ncbi:MAG: ArgE/DapE family deacylase [Methanoregulaceae archaeon]|jgi:succinyl-diaminopimelate desuccinylase
MDVADICSNLIKIRSENPPGKTHDIIEYICSMLENWGVRSIITEKEPGKCNLVTEQTQNKILFCGHVDVVPAMDEGWTVTPFSGTVKDGSVFGRGATDMKGGCAAILAACNAFIQANHELPVQLAFVCDEETGGDAGIQHLIEKHLIDPCDCLIAEPTPIHHPNIGQKGLIRLELEFNGTPGHGSLYPAVGINAIMEALSLIEYVKELNLQNYPVTEDLQQIISVSSQVLEKEFNVDKVSDVLTKLMFNPGVIRGGEKSNIVAQRCELELELRIPWGCNIPTLLEGIRSHSPHGRIIEQTIHEPSITDPRCRLVMMTCQAVEQVYGGDVSPIVQWAASDARHLRAAGFNVIEYGPGEMRYLHALNEHVKIESLKKASLIYYNIMQASRDN